MTKANSVLDLMKETPLVRLKGRAASHPRAQLWGKLEFAMPGQMKDRAALQMVIDGEDSGALRPGGMIVESSSGTMAEGLTRVASLRGYRIKIVTDPRLDAGSVAKLRALGAEVVVVSESHPTGGWQQARLETLQDLLAQNPGAFWPRQYDSPSNPRAYYNSVAKELLRELGTNIAALVASVGSGGSLCGTARALRESIPNLRVVAVDAVGSVQFYQPQMSRLQSGHGNNLVATNLDYSVIDEVHWTSDGEAFNGARELARRDAIFAGGSSGATYVAASWAAEQFDPGQHVVALFPDRGERYAATIYSDEFMAEHRLTDIVAPPSPLTIRYGVDVAKTWSRAELPHHNGQYFAPNVTLSSDFASRLKAAG